MGLGVTQMKAVCVLLTADRQEYTNRAVRRFFAQDYRDKQLLVWDTSRIYLHTPPKWLSDDRMVHRHQNVFGTTIGALRNVANQFAIECMAAEAIVHWDSDDWSAADRLKWQMSRLALGYQITGYGDGVFRDLTKPTPEAWEFRSTDPSFVLGSSLAYKTKAWVERKFTDTSSGEDVAFTRFRKVDVTANEGRLVCDIHASNTCSKILPRQSEWTRRTDLDAEICRGEYL